jgi:hypothetical protein
VDDVDGMDVVESNKRVCHSASSAFAYSIHSQVSVLWSRSQETEQNKLIFLKLKYVERNNLWNVKPGFLVFNL